MAPKKAVSKPQRGIKRPRTRGGASTSQPSSSRSTRRATGEIGNPPSEPDVNVEEENVERGEERHRKYDLSRLPREVDGRKVPTAKFEPNDLPVYYFGSEDRKFKFYTSMLGRPVHVQKKIDLDFLDECGSDIRSMLNYQGWTDLMKYDAPIYRELVLTFYFNWKEGVFETMVKGVKINFGRYDLSPERHLGEILDVPAYEEVNNLKKEEIFNKLSTGAVYTSAHAHMRTRDLCIELKMLKKVLENMFMPKLGGTEQITASEARLLWKLYTYQKVSLPRILFTAFEHLPQRMDHIVSYGVWMTKIFEHFHVPLNGESCLHMSSSNKDSVGATLLRRMGINMSDYINEMREKHEEQMDEDDEEDDEEDEEGNNDDEEEEEEEMGEGTQTAEPISPIAERQPEPSPAGTSPEVPHPRSSAYAILSSEVKELRKEVGELRRMQEGIERKIDLILLHLEPSHPIHVADPIPPTEDPAVDLIPPTEDPVADPILPTEDPVADPILPTEDPELTFDIEELTATRDTTQGEPASSSIPEDP